MDVVNVIATFTIGHTLAEVGQTPGHEGTEPDLDQHAGELDPALFPNGVPPITIKGVCLEYQHVLGFPKSTAGAWWGVIAGIVVSLAWLVYKNRPQTA